MKNKHSFKKINKKNEVKYSIKESEYETKEIHNIKVLKAMLRV